MTEATVQGDVLEWALEDAGVNRDEILAAVGLRGSAAQSLPLAGPVTLDEEALKYIARATRRSVYFFALPAPPETSRHSVDANFRAPMSNAGQARTLSPDERAAVRDAKRRQQAAEKITRELGHDAVRLPSIPSNATPERAAAVVARWLQWGDVQERRRHITSKTQLFVAIREALEGHGIMTNLLPVEGDALRGFTLHHDHVPLVFVNSAVKHPAARSFTLLHELAHLLRGVDKACDKHDLQSRTSEEAWCNRFAAAFLMSQPELTFYMGKYLKKGFIQDDDIDSVRRIAGYFFCSYYSVAIRLKQLGLASAGLVDAVSGSFEEPAQDGFARGGQTRVQKRLSAYGTGIARLFGEALQNAAVSEIEVRKSLNLKSQNELRNFLALGREAV
ncbi:ImmA/IrrE family metallo-endopeptidase [Arthrobacter sp. M4]|uniref:ImmA/IrrE family metallo-endopeptidase n=1 Tax=Arthrobacter sp. M4 TaxID=218160 RepID=UPI001CDB7A90|nr:ImmA/IrrE family metallo-endopeptidase [Arthrobacter sp. M4]MCA4132629.1 ImmA/IrrE family metallo-endopeptidase [Arthrobacter sp. M4]